MAVHIAGLFHLTLCGRSMDHCCTTFQDARQGRYNLDQVTCSECLAVFQGGAPDVVALADPSDTPQSEVA